MAVTTDKSAFLYSRQSDWQNVFRYLFLGSLIFLAACSNSRHNKDPEFDSDTAISVPEGTTATGYTATATDPNSKDTLTYSVSGGADQALLSIDAMTGVVSFVAAPDFENPADANGDNVYEVELTADDGRSGTASLSLQVTVTSNNQAPVFTSSGTASVPEGATETRYTATASDANATDTLTFSVSGGADQARLTIDSVSGVLSFADAPEFAVPADANGDNDYEVQLSVSDGRSGTDTLDLVITVTEQSNFSLQVTYPTPSANLGGGVTQTTVSGNIVDSSGAPIVLADIDYVDVNGQLATLDLANPGQWSTQVPVTDGPNTIAFELGLTSGTKINSSQELQNFVAHVGFGSMDLDSANNRVFVIDAFVDGVIGVDLTSGARTLISGNGIGAGPTFNSPRDVALDSANNRALVVDYQRNALYAVDLANGDRSELSGSSTGTGVVLDGANAVALDSANGRAIVIASNTSELISVDLASGNRTVLSGAGTGAGPDFSYAADIVIDSANNRAIVSDDSLPGIFEVDLDTGDRAVLSGAAAGSGIELDTPITMSMDTANNRVLVADLGGELIGVDLTTGDRTLITETFSTYGRNGTRLVGVVTDSANNRALVADNSADAILAVDLSNGDFTVFSGSATGSGDVAASFQSVQGMAFDSSGDRLLLPKSSVPSLLAVDLGSGDRSIISGSEIGTGAVFLSPRRLVVDGDNNRAVVTDVSAKALVAVDLDSGSRTILSNNSGVGAGPLFGNPADVFVDADNARAFVLDQTVGLLSVNLVTGDRVIVSDAATGSGAYWGSPDSLDVNLIANDAYVVDDADTAVYAVDLDTGNRRIVSDNAGTGTGPSITSPNDLRIDVEGNRAFLLIRGSSSDLMSVDLASGNRTLVTGTGVGSGQPLLVPYYVDLDMLNDRAFIFDIALAGVIVVELSTGERAVMSK